MEQQAQAQANTAGVEKCVVSASRSKRGCYFCKSKCKWLSQVSAWQTLRRYQLSRVAVPEQSSRNWRTLLTRNDNLFSPYLHGFGVSLVRKPVESRGIGDSGRGVVAPQAYHQLFGTFDAVLSSCLVHAMHHNKGSSRELGKLVMLANQR